MGVTYLKLGAHGKICFKYETKVMKTYWCYVHPPSYCHTNAVLFCNTTNHCSFSVKIHKRTSCFQVINKKNFTATETCFFQSLDVTAFLRCTAEDSFREIGCNFKGVRRCRVAKYIIVDSLKRDHLATLEQLIALVEFFWWYFREIMGSLSV